MDPNSLFNAFILEFKRLFDNCFPTKVIKRKKFKFFSPWITKGLSISVRKKNRLYKKFIMNPTAARESRYKSYKNKLNHLIRIAKRNFYDHQFVHAKGDMKKTCKLINEVVNRQKTTRASFPSSFKSDGGIIIDPSEIANKFCAYFTNVGPNLQKKIPTTSSPFHTFLGNRVDESILLEPTNSVELIDICKSLKNSKATGADNIPMHIIKDISEYISAPLTQIVNLSLAKGIFPDQLKISKIVPIYKADDPELFSNYRPISLLSNFSKIFEKVMYNQLIKFTNTLEILHSLQFGFRKNHSTSLALIHLINKIASSIDHNEITMGIFLDLSKAFDTLNHDILFYKLEHYGIRGTALEWTKSYFSERKCFVQYQIISSSYQTMKCGVPQGSILGPLFFLLYINDLPNVSQLTETLLFADDTSIFCSHPNVDHLLSIMNLELVKFATWMKSNKLSVNLKKSNFVVFRSKRKRINSDISMSLDGTPLNQVHVVKFLGIFLDENLSWKSHISYICKKISKSAGIIFRSRFYLSTKTKLLLCYSLVYPYLTYCNPTWSSTYVTNLKRIFLIQKRIVRAITNAPYRAHSAPIFAQLKLLDIYKLNSFYTAKFMFSYIHSLLPPPFLHLFNRNNNFHNYNTRTASNYRPHICRTDIKQFTILYQGPKVWNSLPTDITSSESRLSFKKKIRNLLINQYN